MFLCVFILAVGCIETGSPGHEATLGVQQEVVSPQVETIVQSYEALSLLGTELYPPEMPSRTKRRREAELSTAKDNYDTDPDSLENIIWYGRRLGYLYRIKDAIEVYTTGLNQYPDSYQLLRHRGHRYISIRRFDDAIDDLERAAFLIRNLEKLEIEPDGQPNRKNIPRSNIQFNIWYHLGLAYYLTGNYDKAISAYKKCLEVSDNDDLLVATTDWLYMTYKKTGNDEAATALIEPIKRRMDVIENQSYHSRILMYKGQLSPDKLINLRVSNDPDQAIKIATQGYGVANWYLSNGEVGKGRELLEKIVEGTSWSAFGFIAAEVDLANLRVGGI